MVLTSLCSFALSVVSLGHQTTSILLQCIQQVDKEVLPELVPRLIDLIKNSIGLGTKVGIASVINNLCTQCSVEDIQPYSGR